MPRRRCLRSEPPKVKNPYTRPFHRWLWSEGRACGTDLKRSRASCPRGSGHDRDAWLQGFQQGRSDMRMAVMKEGT